MMHMAALFITSDLPDIVFLFYDFVLSKFIQMEDIVKYNENGAPVKRLRRKARIVHSENIARKSFWNGHSCLLKELGRFDEDVGKIKPDYVRSFVFENKLIPSTWIVIRIDGCHFHR